MLTCFDIGGSAIKGAKAAAPDQVKSTRRVPTPTHDFEAFLSVLREMIEEGEEQSRGVAISTAGAIDPQTGIAKIANIPCADGRRLQQDLEAALGLPVWIARDSACFALAEAHFGAGKGHETVFGIILGTGVGGCLVVNERAYVGTSGYAGEWGHGPVAATQVSVTEKILPRFRCGCGQIGCIDAVCSARGMEKIHEALHGVLLPSTAIMEAWQKGMDEASLTIDVYLEILSGPLAMVMNTTGPSIAPVGGGLSNAPELIERLDEETRKRMLCPPDERLIVPGQCGIEPGLIGAAIVGFQNLDAD
ncbi:MAG: ROK family protein [Stappiaceae bacterium]